jgi:hypothetical protein
VYVYQDSGLGGSERTTPLSLERPRVSPTADSYNRHRNDIDPEYGLGEEWRRTFLISCEKTTTPPKLKICRAVTGAAPLPYLEKKKVRFFPGNLRTSGIPRCMSESWASSFPMYGHQPNQPLALQYARNILQHP